jgi:hypothetical protein
VRSRGNKRALAQVILAGGLVLCACGSSNTVTATDGIAPGTRPSTLATTAPAISPAPKPGTPVGVTQRVPATGTALVVKVAKVIDPLLGSGAKVPAGMVPVGVLIDVRNAGPSGYDSSYTSDFSLRTAAGRATPVYVPRGACQTYVQDFMNALGVGESRTGCVAYLVPRGKPPTTVTLAPDGGNAHSSVSWVVR